MKYGEKMKKQLLFIIPSLCSGGAEKSLITLLSLIDYVKYDVDLFIFRKEGLFLPNVPKQVNIIDGGEGYALFDGSAAEYIKANLTKLRFDNIINRIKYSKALAAGDRTLIWKCLRKALPKNKKHYDAAIGYLEGNAIYYCVDCVDADKKIGYIHSDYSKLNLDKNFDICFFKNLQSLVGVSQQCGEVLIECFPEIKNKVCVIENITSPVVLQQLSTEEISEYTDVHSPIILTVGRISQPKGYDIAVDAAEILDKSGVDFKWFSIGNGELRTQIEEKIKEKNLEEKFILLGERANPYPYIKGCDIYVQPSYYEGKSIAIDEAKCLAKPIVATKFSTVFDQLADNETAVLAEIDAQSVAEKIMQLIDDKKLCEKLTENLNRTHKGNEEELKKFYALLEE